jgi:hypothetical protein
VGLGRYLNIDRFAAKFNRWIGATAMADKAAPGDAAMQRDPSAVVGLLGEIDRQGEDRARRPEADEELPPFNLEPLKRAED